MFLPPLGVDLVGGVGSGDRCAGVGRRAACDRLARERPVGGVDGAAAGRPCVCRQGRRARRVGRDQRRAERQRHRLVRRLIVVAAALLAAVALPAVRAVAPARADAVTASVHGTTAVLGNARVQRTWHIAPGPTGGIVTAALVDGPGPNVRSWAGPASSDFSVTVNSVPLTSTGSWEVLEASAHAIGNNAGQVVFRLGTPGMSVLGAGLEIDRTYTLHAGSATIDIDSTLVNRTPALLRVGAYTLDELTGAAGKSPIAGGQGSNRGAGWGGGHHPARPQTAWAFGRRRRRGA